MILYFEDESCKFNLNRLCSVLLPLVLFYFSARYIMCNVCPVDEGAFDTSAYISVHKKEIDIFARDILHLRDIIF